MAVTLFPYAGDDFPLLVEQNAPDMMTYLGGPETDEALERRHEKYQRLMREGEARMFRIASETKPAVGIIGWWLSEWHDQPVQEAGWSILTRHQGQGYATEALRLLLRDAAAHGDRALLVANPRVDNAASNAICQRVGMSFRGEEDDEYPPGQPIRTNVWTFDLAGLRESLALGYLD
jgi:RimJ/RimL family protein N-acetyltransferase